MTFDPGPPTTVGEGPDDSGLPQDNSGAVVEDADQGETPHTPPENTATVVEPGGSPSDEIVELYAPTVTSIAPDTAVVGDPDLTLTVNGTNFTENTKVIFNGGEEATQFVSDTEVSTVVKPSLASGPAVVPVGVANSGYPSGTLDFTFTDAPLLTQNIREDSK